MFEALPRNFKKLSHKYSNNVMNILILWSLFCSEVPEDKLKNNFSELDICVTNLQSVAQVPKGFFPKYFRAKESKTFCSLSLIQPLDI